MQYSQFFCGQYEYTTTVSDLPLLEQGFRLASVHFSDDFFIAEMQSTFVRGDGQGNGTTTVLGPVHGELSYPNGNLEPNTTLDMTPYWAPNDPKDRIAAVSACCMYGHYRDGADGGSVAVVQLKTEGGSRIEAQPSWGGVRNW